MKRYYILSYKKGISINTDFKNELSTFLKREFDINAKSHLDATVVFSTTMNHQEVHDLIAKEYKEKIDLEQFKFVLAELVLSNGSPVLSNESTPITSQASEMEITQEKLTVLYENSINRIHEIVEGMRSLMDKYKQ